MRISDWSSDVCSSDLTTNPRAYDDYLRGLNFDRLAFKGDFAGNVPQAIAAFKRAVSEDPDFALAWAKLSSERAVARYWGVDQREANLQAMELEARSEEHTSELQSLMRISYAVFC